MMQPWQTRNQRRVPVTLIDPQPGMNYHRGFVELNPIEMLQMKEAHEILKEQKRAEFKAQVTAVAELAKTGRGRSESEGGGAPLHGTSPVADATPGAQSKKVMKTESSSPSDEGEMALVRASTQFSRMGMTNQPNGPTGGANNASMYRNANAGPSSYNAGSYGVGRNAMVPATPQPARPATAFQGGANMFSPPDQQYCGQFGGGHLQQNLHQQTSHFGNNPWFQEGAAIQQQLITLQQYVHVSPGIPSNISNQVRDRLVAIGQALNTFVTKMVNDQKVSAFTNGELRIQINQMGKEILERKKHTEDLQNGIKQVSHEKSMQDSELANVRQSLAFAEANAKHLQLQYDRVKKDADAFNSKEQAYVARIRFLESETEKLRHQETTRKSSNFFPSVDLPEAPDTPTPHQKKRSTDIEEGKDDSPRGDPIDRITDGSPGPSVGASSRKPSENTQSFRRDSLESVLNPEAPSFGPRASAPDYSKDLLPMLKKQNNLAVAQPKPLKDPKDPYGMYSEPFDPERPLTPLAYKNYGLPSYGPQDARLLASSQPDRSNYRSQASMSKPYRQEPPRYGDDHLRGNSISQSTSTSSYHHGTGNSSNYNYQNRQNKDMRVGFPTGNRQQGFNPQQGVNQQQGVNHQQPPLPISGTAAMGGNGLNLTGPDTDPNIPRDKERWEDDDIGNAFARLYELMEGIVASQHCNAPYNEPDTLIPSNHPITWEYILALGLPNRTASASHMSHLMGKPEARHYIVKRVIVDYIFHRMIQPEVFYGFSTEVDGHLTALQGRMRARNPVSEEELELPLGRPQGKLRQRIIEDHARLIDHIIKSPEGVQFRANLITKHTELLTEILSPMRNCNIEEIQAKKAVNIVVKAAWTITSKIWTSGMTIHFFFPETGSKFSCGQMRPMNKPHHLSAEELQYTQWRVMLVVTPTLSLRDDRDLNSLRTQEMMKADVLVMK